MPNFHDEMLGFSALERTSSEKNLISEIDKILLAYSKYRGRDAALHRLVVSQFCPSHRIGWMRRLLRGCRSLTMSAFNGRPGRRVFRTSGSPAQIARGHSHGGLLLKVLLSQYAHILLGLDAWWGNYNKWQIFVKYLFFLS